MGVPCLEGERGLGMRPCQCPYCEEVTGLSGKLQRGWMSYFTLGADASELDVSPCLTCELTPVRQSGPKRLSLVPSVCLLVGCISHESLLCVNEGLASLEVHSNPPPIIYLHCWFHIAPKQQGSGDISHKCSPIIVNITHLCCLSYKSLPAPLHSSMSFVGGFNSTIWVEDRGLLSHKDPPGGLIYSPRQAWSLRGIWAWLIILSLLCLPLSPGCEIPGGPSGSNRARL